MSLAAAAGGVADADPEVTIRAPGSPVPTKMSSTAAPWPKRTASPPTERAFDATPGTGLVETMKSSSGVQVVPLSAENQTPPLAAPAYTRSPSGPTARAVIRPLTGGRPAACPKPTTEGPSGAQLSMPCGPGAAGGAA